MRRRPELPALFDVECASGLAKAVRRDRLDLESAASMLADLLDIPAETVKAVVAQLRDRGAVTRGWIGVQIQPVTAEIADSLAVGQRWEGDERIVLFVKMAEGVELTEGIKEKIRQSIRDNVSPRHIPARIIAVAAERWPPPVSEKR